MFWNKLKQDEDAGATSSTLEVAEIPVKKAILAVCEKCGRKLAAEKDARDTPATELRKTLKEKCSEKYGKRVVRPVTSSCLDLCPNDRVTVAMFPLGASKASPKFFTVAVDDIESAANDVLKACDKYL